MRYATVLIEQADQYLLPAAELYSENTEVTDVSLQNFNVLADGTGVTLSTFRGPINEIKSFYHNRVNSLDTETAAADGIVTVYRHFDPDELGDRLLSITRNNELLFDVPMPVVSSGKLRTTIIGEEKALRNAIDQPPENVTLSLESYGEYTSSNRNPLTELTNRQREVIELALNRGYYASPKTTTHKELAAELSCSPTNVGEHLRRAERRILESLFN